MARVGIHHATVKDASVARHKSVGFTAIGCFPKVGYKLGAWHDVSWWYAEIRDGEPG
ncbi:MAG: hypothetical protein VCE74_04360 [Alphaproteobacteria bacterium]